MVAVASFPRLCKDSIKIDEGDPNAPTTASDFKEYLAELQQKDLTNSQREIVEFVEKLNEEILNRFDEQEFQYSMYEVRRSFGVCLQNGDTITPEQAETALIILETWLNSSSSEFDPQGIYHLLNEMTSSSGTHQEYRDIATLQEDQRREHDVGNQRRELNQE